MINQNEDNIYDELTRKAPIDLVECLKLRDGAVVLLNKLPTYFNENFDTAVNNKAQRVWELFGLWFRDRNRYHEALSIMSSLYTQLLIYQLENNQRVHKGVPLVWMSDFYEMINFPIHVKRNLMLTLIEDAITSKGNIALNPTGVYFRLVGTHGLPDLMFKKYETEIYEVYSHNKELGIFPEMILQELDNNWMTEIPSPNESGVFTANIIYMHHLINDLGESTGKGLERLADYLLSCMPGCRTTRRVKTKSTDYDIVCSLDGFDVDFRSEFGRYFVCECKDWDTPADFTTMAKFCRVLDSTKARFGILFSKNGISGQGETKYAEREQLKVFQDRGMVIVVIDEKDFNYLVEGGNFINMLRERYETVRLDLNGI